MLAVLIAVAALLLAVGFGVFRHKQRLEMRRYFASVAKHVVDGALRKNPLVLDVQGQPEGRLLKTSISEPRLRRRLIGPDWVPPKFQTWDTDVSDVAKKAFELGYDALVLRNVGEGETLIVTPLSEHRIKVPERLLIERLLLQWDRDTPDVTHLEGRAVGGANALSDRQMEYVNRKLAEGGVPWKVDKWGANAQPRPWTL